MLDLLREAGIAYVPYFPLGSAFPGMPKVAGGRGRPGRRRSGRRYAGAGRAGLAARPRRNVLLIPGTSSLAHLEENLAVASVELGRDLAELEAIAAP